MVGRRRRAVEGGGDGGGRGRAGEGASGIDGKAAAGAGLISLSAHLAELGTGTGTDSARGAARSVFGTASAGRRGVPVVGAVELSGESITLRNQGLALARGDILLILESVDLVEHGLVATVISRRMDGL